MSHDRHGKPRWRLRRTIKGRKIDCYLPGKYGSDEFREAYEAAHEAVRSPSRSAKTGTVGQLVETYLGSAAFRNLADRTKVDKRLRMDWIKRVIGDAAYARVKPHHIEALMAKKGGPESANRLKKEMSQLYGVAAKNFGFAGLNPAKLADSFKTVSDGFHTWTDGEIAAYRSTHASGTMARLALEIMLGTGCARKDAALMTRANLRGPDIVYRRAKTGTEVVSALADIPELMNELSLIPADRLVLLAQPDGKPYKADTLGRHFKRWCAEAGLPDACRAHGLRKAHATRLAEAGATAHEIMANMGHETLAMAEKYTAAANRRTMGASGRAKLRPVS